MNFVVELFRVSQHQLVLHVGVMPSADEVVVPRPLRRGHEKTQETIGQKHLNLKWTI